MWAYRHGPNETYESELPAYSELLDIGSPTKDDDYYGDFEPDMPETNLPMPIEELPIAKPNKTFEELLEEQLSKQHDEFEAAVAPSKRKPFLKRKEGGLSSASKRTRSKQPSEKKQEKVERKPAIPIEKPADKKAEKPVERKPLQLEKPARTTAAPVRVKTAPPKPAPKLKATEVKPEAARDRTPEKKSSPPKRRGFVEEKPLEIEYDKEALEDVDTELNAHFQSRLNELEENLMDFRNRNKELSKKIKEYSEVYQTFETNIELIQQQKKSVKAKFEAELEAELKRRRNEFLEQLKAKEQSLAERKDPEMLNELRASLARLKEESNLVDAKNKIEVKQLSMELQDETKEVEELEAEMRQYSKVNARGDARSAR
mmetsp:Transcript_3059/g.6324  ORF Transcript_3059/g.6324 Transcript_3059/m.6324 type:complete len:373 (-) Transcript_3059:3-1121(-)